MAEDLSNSIDEPSRNSSHRTDVQTGRGVIVDIGTGDGHFVYTAARQNPNQFYIGIDANTSALEKISEKVYRKPTKGGAPNALFVNASVEDLPSELDGVADEVHVHFPWGSLLQAVACGNQNVLRAMRRICSEDALLEIVIGSDPDRDRSELKRLAVPELTRDYISNSLAPAYAAAGFEVMEQGVLQPSQWPDLRTSWAKRLRGGTGRLLVYIIARAVKVQIASGADSAATP